MFTVSNIGDKFDLFVQGLWGCESRRRIILKKWFGGRPNNMVGVSRIFSTFLTNILKDPIAFKIDLEKVWFFEEENLALPLSWFSRDEREFLAILVRHSEALFGEIVELPSGDFVLRASTTLNNICKRRINRLMIIRDFALILIEHADPTYVKPRPELFLHLIIAVHTLVVSAYSSKDFNPRVQWTKRLLVLNKVLKAKDVRRSLEEIEVFFIK